MKTNDSRLLNLLSNNDVTFFIPPYQRNYEWSEPQCQVFLDDTPRMRQLYYDYGCFMRTNVRLESLNYALKYIRSRNVRFNFLSDSNLREIIIQDTKLIFIYEYCLSQSKLIHLAPEKNSIIVNLHNWNGESCISSQAYAEAKCMNVRLLTMKAFYGYINEIMSTEQ